MDSEKIIKAANKVMVELLKKDLPNNEINDLIDLVDEIRLEALTIPVVVGQSEQLLVFADFVKRKESAYIDTSSSEEIVNDFKRQ